MHRVDIKGEIQRLHTGMVLDKMRLLYFNLGSGQDVACGGKDWLDGKCDSIPDEVVCHPLVIFGADVSMVSPTIMGLATPTLGWACWVKHWQSEFTEHGDAEEGVADAVGHPGAAHGNNWV